MSKGGGMNKMFAILVNMFVIKLSSIKKPPTPPSSSLWKINKINVRKTTFAFVKNSRFILLAPSWTGRIL
jgi:hypothetical protein